MFLSFLINTFPLVVLLGALIYVPVYIKRRHSCGRLPFIRHLTVYALICYVLSLIYFTLLWYYPDITFDPGYHFLNLRPFIWVNETYEMGAAKMLKQLVLNIAMFVPLGLLAPMAVQKLRTLAKTALTVLGTTLTIETLQYFMGRSADIDDLIMNFAGGLLGYMLFWALNKSLRSQRLWIDALNAAQD